MFCIDSILVGGDTSETTTMPVGGKALCFSNTMNLKILDEIGKILKINEATLRRIIGLLKDKTFLVTGK